MGLIEKVGFVQRLEQGDRWPKEKLRGQRGHRTHLLWQQSVWSVPASSGSWCDWKTESEEEDTKISGQNCIRGLICTAGVGP